MAADGRWRRHTPVEETGQEGTRAACCQIFGGVQIFGGEALIFRRAQISSEAQLLREAQIFGRDCTSRRRNPITWRSRNIWRNSIPRKRLVNLEAGCWGKAI